jgi:hypothetical protein
MNFVKYTYKVAPSAYRKCCGFLAQKCIECGGHTPSSSRRGTTGKHHNLPGFAFPNLPTDAYKWQASEECEPRDNICFFLVKRLNLGLLDLAEKASKPNQDPHLLVLLLCVVVRLDVYEYISKYPRRDAGQCYLCRQAAHNRVKRSTSRIYMMV